jgi:hypothetical protein
MKEVKEKISSLNKKQNSNGIFNLNSFLELPLNSNQSSSVFLNINNIKEHIGRVYLVNIHSLFENDFEKFKDLVNEDKQIIQSTSKSIFINASSSYKILKANFDFLLLKSEKEGLDNSKYIEKFKAITSDLEFVMEGISKLYHFEQSFNKFSKIYSSVINKEFIIEDFKEFLGEKEFDEITNLSIFSKYVKSNNQSGTLESYNNLLDEIYLDLKNKNFKKYATIAELKLYAENNNTPIEKFIINANINDSISLQSEFENPLNIDKFYLFKDNSSLIHYKNGNKRIFTFNEFQEFRTILEEETVNNILRKKPKTSKFFKNKMKEEDNYDEIFLCINTFLENEQILKNLDFNLEQWNSSTESLYDYICNESKNYKVRQMCQNLASKKYKHLFNSHTEESVKNLIEENGFNDKKLQDFVGKKLAMFKTPEDLNNYLYGLIKQLGSFNIDILKEKLNLMNIEPVINENNIIVVKVENFEQSKSLGSKSWCISRDDYYFENYTTENSKQYFLFDFNKKETDLDSMIGFTLYHNGQFRSQHLKNDDYLTPNDFLKKIRDTVIIKNPSLFELDENLKYLIPSETKEKKKELTLNIG